MPHAGGMLAGAISDRKTTIDAATAWRQTALTPCECYMAPPVGLITSSAVESRRGSLMLVAPTSATLPSAKAK